MKKITSLLLALVLLLSALGTAPLTYAAEKQYAEKVIEQIQKKTGFVPGETSFVVGNCYAFVSAVCERLYGKAYQEEMYNGYQCRHRTGNFYTVSTLRTSSSMDESNINSIIFFFIQNAVPGDVVHYGSLGNSSSTHTFMIQSIDNKKMRIFHSNYATREYGSSTCHIDTIYWDSFRDNPTQAIYKDGKLYSHNSLFYNKMRYSGMGVTINRYTNYDKKFYAVHASCAIPPNVTATRSSSTSILLKWNAVDMATKYEVDYKLATDDKYTARTYNCFKTSFDLIKLKLGKKYDFRVRAYVGEKWMPYSKVVSKKILPPTITSSSSGITPAHSGMLVKWNKRDDITGVRVYRSDKEDGTFKVIKTVTDNTVGSFVDKNIAYGKTYYYKLQRYLTQGKAEYSTTSSAFKVTYKLKTPKVTYKRIDSDSVQLHFAGDGHQKEFVYYVKLGKKTVVKETAVTASDVTLNNLEVGDEYTAYAAEKTNIGKGAYGSVSFKVVPRAVSNVKATPFSGGVKVTFDEQSDVDGYYIYRSATQETGFVSIAEVQHGKNYYIDNTIKANTQYYYKVNSYKINDGNKFVGEMSKQGAGARFELKAPQNLKVTRSTPYAMRLQWDKADRAQGYTVYYKPHGGKWTSIEAVAKTAYLITNLSPGTTYYFTVKSESLFGKSDSSAKIKLRAQPPTPAAPTLKKLKKGIKVSYTPAHYAAGYMIYRANKKNGTYQLITTINGNTTKAYNDTGLTKDKTYYYKIICFIYVDGVKYKSDMSDPAGLKFT